MSKHIHIHVGTKDAGFNESDHPRASNGQFGHGQSASRHAAEAKSQASNHNEGSAKKEKSGKSEYSKAREADLDNRKDADYAKGKADKVKRIALLENQYERLVKAGAPLRKQAAVVKELESLGWKNKAAPAEVKADKPAPADKPKTTGKPAAKAKAQAKTSGGSSGVVQTQQALALAKKLGKTVDPDQQKK